MTNKVIRKQFKFKSVTIDGLKCNIYITTDSDLQAIVIKKVLFSKKDNYAGDLIRYTKNYKVVKEVIGLKLSSLETILEICKNHL